MAEKPRVKAPKQRHTTSSDASSRRRMLTIGAAVAGVVDRVRGRRRAPRLIGGTAAPTRLRCARISRRQAARSRPSRRCEGAHSLDSPTGRRASGTPIRRPAGRTTGSPPTSVGTVIWDARGAVQLARVVHNLEHGGVFIFYGEEVSDATVAQLEEFYEVTNGTIMAPYSKLGDKFALGAWVTTTRRERDTGNGLPGEMRHVRRGRVSRPSSARSSSTAPSASPSDLRRRHVGRLTLDLRRGGGTGETRPP